jgi:hypothetical protein
MFSSESERRKSFRTLQDSQTSLVLEKPRRKSLPKTFVEGGDATARRHKSHQQFATAAAQVLLEYHDSDNDVDNEMKKIDGEDRNVEKFEVESLKKLKNGGKLSLVNPELHRSFSRITDFLTSTSSREDDTSVSAKDFHWDIARAMQNSMSHADDSSEETTDSKVDPSRSTRSSHQNRAILEYALTMDVAMRSHNSNQDAREDDRPRRRSCRNKLIDPAAAKTM